MDGKVHLDQEVFLGLSDPGSEGDASSELEWAWKHVDECAACRQRLGQYRAGQRELDTLKVQENDQYPQTKGCPECGEWAELAAGLLDEGIAAAYVRHAAECGICGPLLRAALEDLAAELSEEERRQIGLLPSSTAEGRRRLIARMQQAAEGRRPWHPAWKKWAWGTVAVAAATAASVLVLMRMRKGPADASELLAQAYSSRRTLELRIPGAAYAPLGTVRGEPGDVPLPLLNAEVMIEGKLAAQPSSPEWLALWGRAELLNGRYSDARGTLERALRLTPNSVDALVDLATAEYELAEQEGRDQDYMPAAEHLSEALKLKRDDAEALFNRALVYEQIGSAPLAIQDWEEYLRVDPSSQWASKVAREHLDALKRKTEPPPESALPPSDPTKAIGWLEQRLEKPPPKPGTLDSSDERLLDAAVSHWLPDSLFSRTQTQTTQQVDAHKALVLLAGVLRTQHGDDWLGDVLAEASLVRNKKRSQTLGEGLEALAAAIATNAQGRANLAQTQAERAEHLLRKAGNPAAALRAQFELAFAYQREEGSAALCEETAREGLQDLGARQYPWLKGQLLFEEASGDATDWKLGLAGRAMEQAAGITREAGYGTLYLREASGLAGLAAAAGDYRQAWRWGRTGLEQYWSGEYPPVRRYTFFAEMEFGAEAAGDWQVAESLAQEAAATTAVLPNRPLEAMARFRLASVAGLAEDRDTAKEEFGRASRIFASLPSDPSMRTYQAYAQIYLAGLEVQTGDTATALKRLEEAEPLVRGAQNDELALRLYRGLGQAYLSAANVGQAQEWLLRAAAIAERSLYSLPNNAARVAGEEATADVYRGLVRAELKGRDNPKAALGIWEWYRSGPVRAEEKTSGSLEVLLPATAEDPRGRDASLSARFGSAAAKRLEREARAEDPESVVTYIQFPDGIEIWSLHNGAIEAEWVPVAEPRFRAVAERFEEECADPQSDLAELRADGKQLYDWLIAPEAGGLGSRRELVLETDGGISRVPFQALVSPDGKYVGNRLAIVYSPGLGYDRVLRAAPRFSSADRVLTVGAPALGGDWQTMLAALPTADAEAQMVATDFHSAVVLTGQQATLPAVLENLPEAKIFHFAGHALAEGKRTGLVLAASKDSAEEQAEGGALLGAAQFGLQNLRECRLAVLSACSTASGESSELVNPASLVGAFLLAGVPEVVASRWNVDSSATESLMDVFYRRLLAGETAARALQEASERVQQNPETAHPYFWAAFSAYGR